MLLITVFIIHNQAQKNLDTTIEVFIWGAFITIIKDAIEGICSSDLCQNSMEDPSFLVLKLRVYVYGNTVKILCKITKNHYTLK
jgi:hypothetical protein